MSDLQPTIILTMTGEIFQPVRLYYHVHDLHQLHRIFKKISCMYFDESNRCIWLYDGEAKPLKFKQPYASIPKNRRPIILGAFYRGPADDNMHLDVGSIERATAAVPFFDKRIGRSIAEVKCVAIYNKLFSDAADHPGSNFDRLFGGFQIEEIEALIEARIQRMEQAVKSGRLEDVLQERSHALVDLFPVRYYDEGIAQLEMSLQMRQVVAVQRWQPRRHQVPRKASHVSDNPFCCIRRGPSSQQQARAWSAQYRQAQQWRAAACSDDQVKSRIPMSFRS